jgi:hypothetical protein
MHLRPLILLKFPSKMRSVLWVRDKFFCSKVLLMCIFQILPLSLEVSSEPSLCTS